MISKKLISWIGAGFLTVAIPTMGATIRHHKLAAAHKSTSAIHLKTAIHPKATALKTRHHHRKHLVTTKHATKHLVATKHATKPLVATKHTTKNLAATTVKPTSLSHRTHSANTLMAVGAGHGVTSMHSGHGSSMQ